MVYPLEFRTDVLNSLNEGSSLDQVATQFKITKNTVRNWIKRNKKQKLSPNPPKKRLAEIDEKTLKNYLKKYPTASLEQISLFFGTSRQTIGNRIHEFNIPKKQFRQKYFEVHNG
jgi:transposase-like protein